MLRGGAEYSQWTQKHGEGTDPSVEEVYTPATLPGLGAKVTYLHSQGTVGFDWRHRRPTTRGAAGYLRRDGTRLQRQRQAASASSRSTTTPSSTSRSCGRRGSSRSTALVPDGLQQERPGDPVLHAAVGRRRIVAARLQQLAVPRREQPAAAGRVAHHGEPLPRHRVLLRRRQGHASSRRISTSTTCRTTTGSGCASTRRSRRRCASSWRRATKGCPSCSRPPRPSEGDAMSRHSSSDSSDTPRGLAPADGRRARRSSPPASRRRAAVLFRRSDRPRSRNRRTRRRRSRYEHRLAVRDDVQPVRRPPGYKPTGVRAQNINTIDEVPDSSWFTNRIGTRPVTIDEITRGPLVGAPPDPSHWVLIQGEDLGRPPGLHREGRQGRDVVPGVRSADVPGRRHRRRGRRDEDLLGAGLQPGGVVPHDVRSEDTSRSIRRRRSSGRTASGRRSRTTTSTRSSSTWRGTRTARTASSRDGCCPARSSAASAIRGTRPDDPNDIVPHEHRRELRALRVFGAWTNLTDLKAANTLDTLVTENGRTVVKHYLQDVGSTFGDVQRQVRVGSQLGALLPGRHDAEAPLHARVRAEPVADGATTRNTRRSASSKATCSIRGRGARRRRRRPTWSCATTMRSGRRGAWRRSPTS